MIPRVTWEGHGDLMRTQLQETGRIRTTFLRLHDLVSAVDDLGIDPADVRFVRDYAVVGHEAETRLRAEYAEADRGD